MEFFDLDVSTLFLNKFGEKIFNDILDNIRMENPLFYNSFYIEVIFKLAFYDFIGLNNEQIKDFIIYEKEPLNLDIDNYKKIHKKSIPKIKKYLENNIQEILDSKNNR